MAWFRPTATRRLRRRSLSSGSTPPTLTAKSACCGPTARRSRSSRKDASAVSDSFNAVAVGCVCARNLRACRSSLKRHAERARSAWREGATQQTSDIDLVFSSALAQAPATSSRSSPAMKRPSNAHSAGPCRISNEGATAADAVRGVNARGRCDHEIALPASIIRHPDKLKGPHER
jgi:hypothetical protein